MADSTSVKTALDRLLADRKPALEQLASAQARRAKAEQRRADLEQEEADAETAYRDAHSAARDAGWGARELADAGFPAPSRGRDARRRNRPRSNPAGDDAAGPVDSERGSEHE